MLSGTIFGSVLSSITLMSLKVKIYLIEPYAMKTYGGMDVEILFLLTSAIV
jgi:hypothetical protein